MKGEETPYTNYRKKMTDEEAAKWPPKFWKFHLTTEGSTPTQVAFTDARRFGRVRLVDCPGDEIRANTPLKENGPDPVVDKEIFTEEYLRGKMQARHVPVKALLLDQTMISGIGNWVADETLYQAKLHPERYSDEFSDEEVKRLWENIVYVCQTAVDVLADSDKFPSHWLFNYRWGKGSDVAKALPSGEKLAFITVGGRTSCYAPERQKKSGNSTPASTPKSKKVPKVEVEEKVKVTKSKQTVGGKEVKKEQVESVTVTKKRGRASTVVSKEETVEEPAKKKSVKVEEVKVEADESLDLTSGRRRSGRLRG